MQEFITRQLFPAVLSLSLSGAFIGTFIAAIHPFTGKYFSKKWNYYIWLLVVVRLLLPFHFESGFLKPLDFHAVIGQNNDKAQSDSTIRNDDQKQINAPAQSDDTQQPELADADRFAAMPDTSADAAAASASASSAGDAPVPSSGITSAAQHHETQTQSDTFSSAGKPKGTKSGLWAAAAHIWFVGAVFALFIKLLNYQHFKNAIRKNCTRIAEPRILTMESNFCARLHIQKIPAIYESAAVASPMTIGLRNPMIVIPKRLSDGNVPVYLSGDRNLAHFQLVLHHELIHVARKDLLYKWIYQLLLCVHWFNPVLHLIGRQINRDCELSCDEAILPELTETGKQMYGNILLDTAEQNIAHRQNAFSTTLLENKKDLKRRLDGILNYKKTTRRRFAVSVCVFVMILALSACSTVWISSDAASASESGHDSSVSSSADSSDTAFDADANDKLFGSADTDTQGSNDASSDSESFHYDDTDDTGVFMQIFSSLVSADSFVNNFASPDRSSDAWKVYDDDRLLAGEDIQNNWGAYNYMSNARKVLAYGYVLYGSDSFVIAYADQDVDVNIKSAFDIREGKFKLIWVTPDKSIVTLNDTGAETTTTITMKKGRNVLKMVGQGAKVTHLEIDFSDLDESDFENVFYSEDAEYVHLLKNAAVPADKDRVLNSLGYLEQKDASELFSALLAAGTTFTADELCNFLHFSDSALSSQYLLEALRSKAIAPLSADTASAAIRYLDEDCQTEVLKTLPVEDFYDVFIDNIYFLNSSQIDECLADYIGRGGTLTYSMYDEISFYLDESNKQNLTRLMQE